ncbi:MAG TPA: hypothetical protein VHO91_04845 [Rhodopila sp.]|nr:hypothetical protein [Rhodopila sp.]
MFYEKMKHDFDDLDRRWAEQMHRLRLRQIESMEWLDEQHQREKRRRAHYKRFRWFYWSLGGIVAAVWIISVGALGWAITELALKSVHKPSNVAVQQPATGVAPSMPEGPTSHIR